MKRWSSAGSQPGRSRRFGVSEVAIAVFGLLVVPTVLASGLYVSSTTSRDRAVERASRDLMVRLSLSHVGLEGVLAGRSREGQPGGAVYANLDRASDLCLSLAEGGSTPFGRVAPLDDARDRQNARSLCEDLDRVRSLTTAQLNYPTIARLEGSSTEAIRREANERYERYAAAFQKVMDRSVRHTKAVARSVATSDRVRGQVQGGTIAILVGLLAVMAVLARRNRLNAAELARQAAAMQHRAFHDPLTDLPNRSLFADRVDHALARFARSGEAAAVLFMDLDGFKGINDTLGHEIGDRLLVEVARRLTGCMRGSDTVARFGGDEFAVLVGPLTEDDEAAVVVERVLAALTEPFVIDAKELVAHASIGMAFSGPGGRSTGELLRNADVAMYVAKESGKGRCVVFEPAMHSAMLERLELEADLRRALDNDELVVHYQPVVELAGSTLSQVEALVRWAHPRRGLVPPAEFIHVAEDTGLISAFGEWVLRHACVQVRKWQLDHPCEPSLRLAVNLSAGQLTPGLADMVARALEASGLAPSLLTLEITESLFAGESVETLTYLSDLKAMGVKLAIDDFGTGYSSLSRLREFPIDALKIDQSFVAEVATSVEGRAIVKAVIAMAKSLGLEVVAEGVEDAAQLEVLRRQGCSHVQGYYLARPMEAAAMGQLLAGGGDDGSTDQGRRSAVAQPGDAAVPRYFARIPS